ncbi:hypothetical protein HOD30_04280 [Candidatus Peregrinibacteria bacterium]|jgi:hypothetical protein|nr:hypothetical protein [Candidatus Peregrinibacteria bacterium]MBT4632176.1 hypothetical protein [Candidatus Peregrinibacteria bacterium]MBT5516737.1 hypothetical protein [Candidatus Peregrinibacteria bacterium]MBT5824094.1 hypothetical protein [Candidatus Peregrinibacteria bacterium]
MLSDGLSSRRGEKIAMSIACMGLGVITFTILDEVAGFSKRVKAMTSANDVELTVVEADTDGCDRNCELAVLEKMLSESDGTCVDTKYRRLIMARCPELSSVGYCIKVDAVPELIDAHCD